MKTILLKTGLMAGLSLALVKPAIAQVEFSGGLLGGVSMGSVKVEDIGQGIADAAEGNNIYGFEAGIYAKLLINPFYVKPALLYDYREGDVEYRDANGNQRTDFSVSKIQVPVLFGFHILGPLNVEAGPVYNYLLTVTEDYNTTNADLGRNGLGYRIGATAELGGLTLGLSYQGAAYTEGSSSASFSEPYKLVASLGIRLGGAGDD